MRVYRLITFRFDSKLVRGVPGLNFAFMATHHIQVYIGTPAGA